MNKTFYYAAGNIIQTVTWSHTCFNSGAIAIKLGKYYFVLVCGGNDGNKAAPINNIYVLPSDTTVISSTTPYSNTPPADANCGNNITCSAAITIVNGSTTTQ